jgi:hypothetical protein
MRMNFQRVLSVAFASLFLLLFPATANQLTITRSGDETIIGNVGIGWESLAEALSSPLMLSTSKLRVIVNANTGNGVWTVPYAYYNGIYVGHGCDERKNWFCIRGTTNLILDGISQFLNGKEILPKISGGDAARLFWIAGGEFSARKIEFTEGRAVRGGGSIYIISGSFVNLFQSHFTRSTAKYSAAIYMLASMTANYVNMTECIFKENLVHAALEGGALGIYGDGTNFVTVIKSVFSTNKFTSPGGRGQDIFKQSDSSVLFDVSNTYDKTGTVWGMRIVCPSYAALQNCLATEFSQVSKDSGECVCLPRVGEDVSFKPVFNAQSYVPAMIIDRNTNNWRGDGIVLPSHPNVCKDQQYPGKDTTCNFV